MTQVEKLEEVLAAIADIMNWCSVISYGTDNKMVGISLGTTDYLYDTTGVRCTDLPKQGLRLVKPE